jgi:hypothetical protein
MDTRPLLEDYIAGAGQVREAVAGMTASDLRQRPIAGQWSTLEVVCHIADVETLYAERIKRVLVEDRPLLPGCDPDLYAAGLAYGSRNLEEELAIIEAQRRQLATILQQTPESALQRIGEHSNDGPLSGLELLRRITAHIPHHVGFIAKKRRVLEG